MSDRVKMNQKGFSLIEVIIVSAIGLIVLASISQVFISQSQLVSQLVDRVSIADAQRSVTSALVSQQTCSKTLLDATIPAFDPTNIPSTFALNKIPYSGDPASPSIIEINQKLLNSPRVEVQSIELVEIACLILPCTTTSNSFSGSIRVLFKPPVRSRPLEFPIFFKTTGTAGNQTVSECSVSSGVKSFGTQNVQIPNVAANCPGTWSAGFCSLPYRQTINFPSPFIQPPQVIVSADAAVPPGICACCVGTTDHLTARAENITTTGFDLIVGSSPQPGTCPALQANMYIAFPISWLAVGE